MLKQYRKELFPEIEDFSDAINEKRYASIKDLTSAEIVWFKPSFYKGFTNWFSITLLSGLIGLCIWSFIKGNIPGILISSLMIYFQAKLTIKTHKDNKLSGDINLYDLLIRDNPVQGNKVKGRYE